MQGKPGKVTKKVLNARKLPKQYELITNF